MSSPPIYRAFEDVRDCAICRSSDLETVDPKASVLRCARCGYRFVSPRPTQAEVARGYSLPGSYESWEREGAARERLWRRRYRQVLEDRRPGSLLDVGAGLGTFMAIAQSEGWIVAGTEVSEIAVAHAREAYGIDLVAGELRADSVPGPFDVIAMWHVIEHVPDPVSTLRTCLSLLHPDGILILGLPNDAASAQVLSAVVRGARRVLRREIRPRYEVLRPGVESHLSHFTPRTIRRALAAADLDVVHLGVDDALPTRSRLGHVVFKARRALTTVTPWNFGAEMLVVAKPRSLEPAP
jgi:2-polyprenyl-3-methyl-5-hydroxy-6-metoxy-1,4-benzoquinol methylase